MEGYLAEVRLFAGNFAPRGWALCQGQLLPIPQHMALFSLLGTTYGGDGRTTFALPDLRGRAPVGTGQGAGRSSFALGQAAGAESVTLTALHLPAHNHPAQTTATINTYNRLGSSGTPGGNVPAGSQVDRTSGSPIDMPYAPASDGTKMAAGAVTASTTIGMTGGGQPFSILSPSIGMNYIICLEGFFPSRP